MGTAAVKSMAPKDRGIHDGHKKLLKEGTVTDLINSVAYSSATWSCKEDEKFGIAKLSEAHSRQAAAKMKTIMGDKVVDMEQEAAQRDAASKQKRKQESDVSALLEEQMAAEK